MLTDQPLIHSMLLLAAGIVLLAGGGEGVVTGATRLAKRLGMSSLLVGLTVVAFGTSLPELFASSYAAVTGHPDISIGNVVGSNIANIGLIIGLSAAITPLMIHFSRISLDLCVLLAASAGLAIPAFFGTLSAPAGFFAICALIAYVTAIYRRDRNSHTPEKQTSPPRLRLTLPLIAGGFIALAVGADLFVQGAVETARHLGISELIIGLTLTALGTSLPELAASLAAIRKKEGDMIIGNVIGSNLFNLLMVLGATALIQPLPLSRDILYRDLPVMGAFTCALFFFCRAGKVHRWAGVILLFSYGLYILTL